MRNSNQEINGFEYNFYQKCVSSHATNNPLHFGDDPDEDPGYNPDRSDFPETIIRGVSRAKPKEQSIILAAVCSL